MWHGDDTDSHPVSKPSLSNSRRNGGLIDQTPRRFVEKRGGDVAEFHRQRKVASRVWRVSEVLVCCSFALLVASSSCDEVVGSDQMFDFQSTGPQELQPQTAFKRSKASNLGTNRSDLNWETITQSNVEDVIAMIALIRDLMQGKPPNFPIRSGCVRCQRMKSTSNPFLGGGFDHNFRNAGTRRELAN